MEGMAYIGIITKVEPIKDADRIERIDVDTGPAGSWSAVSRIKEFKVGDKCEVYLQDSLLPEWDKRFAFMEKQYFIVRMMRLRGAPSEALVMPVRDSQVGRLSVGCDITSSMGVVKYERVIPEKMRKDAIGHFPSFIPKTSEANFQAVPHLVAAMCDNWFYSSEKADGTSITVYHWNKYIGVCGRRYEYADTETHTLWGLARQYRMPEILPTIGNVAIQMEAVGPGIPGTEGNPMGLAEPDIRVYDIYNIDKYEFLDGTEIAELCEVHEWPMVPITVHKPGERTNDNWRTMAEGLYPNGKQREGIVVRPLMEARMGGDRLSFKVLNLNYGR